MLGGYGLWLGVLDVADHGSFGSPVGVEHEGLTGDGYMHIEGDGTADFLNVIDMCRMRSAFLGLVA